MKPTFGVLSLLAVLALIGTLVVRELKQITIEAGGPTAVLPITTAAMSQQQENQQQLMRLVESAMKKAQSNADDK